MRVFESVISGRHWKRCKRCGVKLPKKNPGYCAKHFQEVIKSIEEEFRERIDNG